MPGFRPTDSVRCSRYEPGPQSRGSVWLRQTGGAMEFDTAALRVGYERCVGLAEGGFGAVRFSADEQDDDVRKCWGAQRLADR